MPLCTVYEISVVKLCSLALPYGITDFSLIHDWLF